MTLHYLQQIPLDQIACDTDSVVITQYLFDQLADYTRSHPTAPKPGRIFKKNLKWSSEPANWFVFICWQDGDTNAVWNHGRKAYIV